ncbi:MAG: cobalt-precorrin-6A reductase [Rhodospirillales bacterium]
MREDRGSRRLLILGGTAEAAELARRALDLHGGRLDVISSLSGATAEPVPPPGRVRSGGFGGPEGLARYLRDEAVDFLIDATHPFAAVMQISAAEAAAATGVARCRLLRPPWPREAGDRWIDARDAAEAAQAVAALGGRAFLALGNLGGGRELQAFAGLAGKPFLLRAISPPPMKLPAGWRFLQARGPFTVADERRLFAERRIAAVVSRQSGGAGAYAKIQAARELGLPVVMIRRPPVPPPPVVDSVEHALDWLERTMKG